MRKLSPRPVLVAALVTTFAIVATACAAPAAEEDIDRTISIAVDGLPADFDPASGLWLTDGNYAGQAVSSPLFFWEGNGQAVPVIAEGYELSDDRRSLTVTLREGIFFADGESIDADAVIASYEHTFSDEATMIFKGTINGAGPEFTAVDDRTVRVDFAVPVFHPEGHYWDVVRLLLVTPILSPAGVADPARARTEPMSVGPYLIESQQTDVEMTLERNPEYWDPESYPYDTVVLKVLADPIAKLNALKSGQVDAARLTTEQLAEAEASGFEIHYGSPNYFTFIVRNPESSTLEPLRDVRVRQAMMLAFDREAIAESIDLGYGQVSSQAFIPGQAEYVEGGDDRYGYDPERARELLAEAGYADGFDVTVPVWGESTSVEPVVQQSLADIGIRVTFLPTEDVGGALMGGDYPLTLYKHYNVNTVRLLDEVFVGFGSVFDQNDEIDRLLALIRQGDAEESAAASHELGEKLLAEAWYIPFSRPPAAMGTVRGVEVFADDSFGPGTWLHHFQVADD